jgi:hypothetical protein
MKSPICGAARVQKDCRATGINEFKTNSTRREAIYRWGIREKDVS